MVRYLSGAVALLAMTASASAQQCNCGPNGLPLYGADYGAETFAYGAPVGASYGASLAGAGLLDGGYPGMEYIGGGSVGASEPLFVYDDRESWKHGYQQVMPFYGGFHAGRPYNYHHVFSQTQTSVGWGMPRGMAYSQQWWHRYENMADPNRAQAEPDFDPFDPQAEQTPTHAPEHSMPTTHALPRPAYPGIAPVQYQPTQFPAAHFQPVATQPMHVPSTTPGKVFQGNLPPQF